MMYIAELFLRITDWHDGLADWVLGPIDQSKANSGEYHKTRGAARALIVSLIVLSSGVVAGLILIGLIWSVKLLLS